MKKIIGLVILVLLVFMSCDVNNLVSNSTEFDTTADTTADISANSTGYVYVLDGNKVLLTNSYDQTAARFLDAGDSITGVSEIPGVGKVVETENGKYYMESGTTFVEMTLPTGTTTLHIHQFSRYTINDVDYIYFGVDKSIYRDTDVDFSNAEEVVADNAFYLDDIKTNLQYMVYKAADNNIAHGDVAAVEAEVRYIDENRRDYLNNGTPEATDDRKISSPTDYIIHSSLNTAFFSMSTNGDIKSIYTGNVITLENDNLGELTAEFNGINGNYGIMFFGQTATTFDNRAYEDTYATIGYNFGLSRDTMFHEYWDHKVYLSSDLERKYLGMNIDNSHEITVDISSYNGTGASIGIGTFTISSEFIDGNYLIPNMWVDTNNDVYVIVGNILYLYDASNNYTSSTVYTHGSRLDAVTILPDGSVIVMDNDGDWYEPTSPAAAVPYTGANIVAEY